MPAEPKNWIEIIITAAPPQIEAAADFLTKMTQRGVLLTDPSDDEQKAQVKGYLDASHNIDAQRAKLELFAQSLGLIDEKNPVTLEFKSFPAEDWSINWKKHFRPREAIEGLIIAPPWDIPESSEGKKVIIIDPGQAFGTGHHESTLLCMKRISRQAKRGLLPNRILDVGCGTGILSLTALAFGTQTALGIDLDPYALEAAQKNAELNNMADRLEFKLTPLAEIEEKFSMIVANITAKDITDLAKDLASHLASDGELVVSGILPEQAPSVRKVLEGAGLSFMERNTMAAWSSLVMA